MTASDPDRLEGLPLDHVAIAVESIDSVVVALEAVTGAGVTHRERVESQGVELAFIGSGDGKLEILQPLAPDTPVGRFLDKRGPGLHHIAYRVVDVDAALHELAARGFDLIDEKGRPGALGHRVAFLHPRSTGGVLVELVQH